MSYRLSRGYSIVELMVALTIGLVLLLGVMAVFVTSRTTYEASETQARMVDDARFAMQLLGEDLRIAGSWGPNSFTNMIDNRSNGTAERAAFLAPMAAGDCGAAPGDLWYTNLDQVVFATNGTDPDNASRNPFSDSCVPDSADWLDETDMLVVRYALPAPIADAFTAPGVIYVRSAPGNSVIFVGTGNAEDVPAQPANGTNHVLQTSVYYVSDFTETAGDGLPSLHRITLTPGPTLVDEMIVPGVENFQIQVGFDSDENVDARANVYMNADNGELNWNDPADLVRVRSVRIWILLRSEELQATVTSPGTYEMGGDTITPDGNYKRLLLSGVFDIRNFQQMGFQQ